MIILPGHINGNINDVWLFYTNFNPGKNEVEVCCSGNQSMEISLCPSKWAGSLHLFDLKEGNDLLVGLVWNASNYSYFLCISSKFCKRYVLRTHSSSIILLAEKEHGGKMSIMQTDAEGGFAVLIKCKEMLNQTHLPHLTLYLNAFY